jgi:hypothetical protein
LYHPILNSEKKYEGKCYSIENINKNISVTKTPKLVLPQNKSSLPTNKAPKTRPHQRQNKLIKMSDPHPTLTNNTIPAKYSHMTRKGNTTQQNKTKYQVTNCHNQYLQHNQNSGMFNCESQFLLSICTISDLLTNS